jgi:hypothetical protein
MRVYAALGLITLLGAGAGSAQAPGQLPPGVRVRIRLTAVADSTFEGTVQRTSEGCTLIAFPPGVTHHGGEVALLRAVSKLWVASQPPSSPWLEVPLDSLRGAEPPSCQRAAGARTPN